MENQVSSSVAGGVASEEGEDGEDESSSTHSQLHNFREQWRQGLQTSSVNKSVRRSLEKCEKTTNKQTRFQGSHSKENRNPNKEKDGKGNEFNVSRRCSKSETEDEDESDEQLSQDLFTRFQKLINNDEAICQAEYDQKMTHISVLPVEVLLYMFKWVVSSELDMQSLDQLSMVCRGFYVCARDSELWKLACYRVWGVHAGNPGKYASWRNMYLQRTRLRYNGVYISKTTYVRHGESSFQDQFYRPWHMVEYFRYLRFFPDGIVLMLTTPDDPYSSLGKLNQRFPRHSAVLVGRYRLHAGSVIAVLKRPRTPEPMNVYQRFNRRHHHLANSDDGEQTFHIALEVKNCKQKANYKLVWNHYAIHTVYKNGAETTSDFELVQNKFPPFWFSRVKSYTAESESPLQ